VYNPSADGDDELMSFFGNGVDLEVSVGFPLNPWFALEGAIGYYRSSSDTVSGSDPFLGDFSLQMDVSVIPITASLRATAHAGPVAFSALGGFGIHMASLEASASSSIFGSDSLSDDDTAFGAHLGGAVSVAVSERASIGLELRRTFVSVKFSEFSDEKFDLGGLRIGAMLAIRL
jgi:hypothetical protein